MRFAAKMIAFWMLALTMGGAYAGVMQGGAPGAVALVVADAR